MHILRVLIAKSRQSSKCFTCTVFGFMKVISCFKNNPSRSGPIEPDSSVQSEVLSEQDNENQVAEYKVLH